MAGRKLYIPEGTLDVLPGEAAFRRKIENVLMDSFRGFGYSEIRTPTFEFFEVFEGGGGEISSESMYRFFDSKGQMLSLRPDMTMPTVRLAATKLASGPLPLRLCYLGCAFRNCESVQGARLREFMQAGVELIGAGSPMADAEVVALAIKALISAGLKKFQIEIGQIGFFKGLLAQAGLTLEEGEALRIAIDKKDTLSLRELLNKMDMPRGIKDIFEKLPEFFGKIELIDKIDEGVLNPTSRYALKNLRDIYGALCDFGYEEYISVDLGMVQNIDYYTGAIFRGYAEGLGFPVCGGGRYDALCGQFGRETPATGIAIGVDRLISLLERQGAIIPPPAPDYLLVFDEGARAEALKKAEELRAKGAAVELCLTDENPKEYAEKRKIKNIIEVK